MTQRTDDIYRCHRTHVKHLHLLGRLQQPVRRRAPLMINDVQRPRVEAATLLISEFLCCSFGVLCGQPTDTTGAGKCVLCFRGGCRAGADTSICHTFLASRHSELLLVLPIASSRLTFASDRYRKYCRRFDESRLALRLLDPSVSVERRPPT